MAQHLPFSRTDIELTPRDIQFECEHCGNILIVDKDGEGLELACPHCGGVVKVPPFQGKVSIGLQEGVNMPEGMEAMARAAQEETDHPVPTFDFSGLSEAELAERLETVEHKLKENASQRTELQGHINRTTIEMHRLTLKMQKAQRRQRDLEAERSALIERKAAS